MNAILASHITTTIVNPYNQNPDIEITLGVSTEHFFATDSYEVTQLGVMFTRLAQIAGVMLLLSLPFLSKKEKAVSNSNSNSKTRKPETDSTDMIN